jgi:putative acetyltransferase
MEIRLERPEDAAAIRSITNAAFRDMVHSNQTEAKIIDALRSADMLTLSLVAIQKGVIAGHAAFSPVQINGVRGDWYGLGPIAVSPDQQRKGVGQLLIRDGLDRLQSMKAAGCVVFGDPSYYSRFGFEHDPLLFYTDAPPGYFQRLALKDAPPTGEVTYHFSFNAA